MRTPRLSHLTAGFLWGLIDPKPQLIDLTIPRAAVRPHPGVRIHLVHSLDAKNLRTRHGLWVTSPARTIIDLAAEASSTALEHATSEAVAKRLMTDRNLDEELGRTPQNHRGRAFETDRHRDQILTAACYIVIRITWRQLHDEPFRVIATMPGHSPRQNNERPRRRPSPVRRHG